MQHFKTYPMPNSTILRINFEKKSIWASPGYQRNSDVWDQYKRQLLIDSILNEYDIPKLYFHLLPKPKELPNGNIALYSIIDGKQRVEAIWSFLEDGFPLADDFEYLANPNLKAGGMKYSELSRRFPELKVRFDSFVLPIVVVDTKDEEFIEEMFSRLNEAVPLSSAEKRQALGGPLTTVIDEISNNLFFRFKVKFSNKRYQHKEVIARLLLIEKNLRTPKGLLFDTKKPFLDEMVIQYRDDENLTPLHNELQDAINKILGNMNDVFRDRDSLLIKQGIVPIYYLLFRSAIQEGKITNISRNRIHEFQQEVKKNKKIAESNMAKAKFDLLEFDRLSIQGTNDASGITARWKTICRYFSLECPKERPNPQLHL